MIIRAFALGCALAAVLQPLRASARGVTQEDAGKALYTQNCMQCHGVRGVPTKSIKAAFPAIPTFNAAFAGSHTPDSIATVLTHGKSTDMPSFKGKLTHDQMMAVAGYVKTLAR